MDNISKGAVNHDFRSAGNLISINTSDTNITSSRYSKKRRLEITPDIQCRCILFNTKTLQRINDALRVNDRLDEAYFLKGRLYLETGDTVTAVSSFQTAIEVNPDRYDVFIQLGLLYAAADEDLALEYFRTARSLRPNSIEALYDEAVYLQEHGIANPARYRQSLDLYDRILELDATNASAAFNKGFVFLEYLTQYDSAEYWFDQAIQRLPYYHQAHYNRGLAIESQGRTEEALAAYDAALSFEPAYTPAAVAKGRVLNDR